MAQASTKDKKWWIPLVVGIIAFVGSAMGSALPRLLFEGEETQRKLIEARISAYNDFFKGQAELRVATALFAQGEQIKAKEAQSRYDALVKDAKFRIGVYGTKLEIEAITDYFRKYSNPPPCDGSNQKWRDDIKSYQLVRAWVFRDDSKQRVDDARLIHLLFDCQLADEVSAK